MGKTSVEQKDEKIIAIKDNYKGILNNIVYIQEI